MFRTILKLRLFQFKRLLDELGFIMVLVFLFATAPLWLRMLEVSLGLTGIQIASLLGFFLCSAHLNRADKDFLRLVYPKSWLLMGLEYFTVSIPVLCWLLYNRYWQGLLVLATFIIFVPFIKLKIKLRGRQKPLLQFPAHFKHHYDWKSGLRQYFVFLFPIYLSGFFLSHFTVAIPIVLFLLAASVSNFYQEAEPDIFLQILGKSPRDFLHYKIRSALGLFWLYCSPLALLFLYFHLPYWYILLVVAIVCSLFPTMAIVLKYASYEPRISLTQNGMVLGLMMAFLCFPFTQPVPILMTLRYYRKALVNLKSYI